MWDQTTNSSIAFANLESTAKIVPQFRCLVFFLLILGQFFHYPHKYLLFLFADSQRNLRAHRTWPKLLPRRHHHHLQLIFFLRLPSIHVTIVWYVFLFAFTFSSSQLWTTFNQLWTTFNQLWITFDHFLVTFDHFRSLSVTFGHFWTIVNHFWSIANHFWTIVNHFWSIVNHFWSLLVNCESLLISSWLEFQEETAVHEIKSEHVANDFFTRFTRGLAFFWMKKIWTCSHYSFSCSKTYFPYTLVGQSVDERLQISGLIGSVRGKQIVCRIVLFSLWQRGWRKRGCRCRPRPN